MGYDSLSYHLLGFGETYYQGQLGAIAGRSYSFFPLGVVSASRLQLHRRRVAPPAAGRMTSSLLRGLAELSRFTL